MPSQDQSKSLLELTVKIVAAHVGRNEIATPALPGLIEQIYTALKNAGQEPAPAPAEKQLPFVAPKRSIFPDYIICLEDGRRLKTLKRHLRSEFGLSPEQYREKWGLAADYPMVAPNYAEHRSRLAKELGLGRKNAAEADTPPPASKASVSKAAAPKTTAKKSSQPKAASDSAAAAPATPTFAFPESSAAPLEPRRRAEPTAASVFSNFRTPVDAEPAPIPAPADVAPVKKRGRKPFSKQLARSMPR